MKFGLIFHTFFRIYRSTTGRNRLITIVRATINMSNPAICSIRKTYLFMVKKNMIKKPVLINILYNLALVLLNTLFLFLSSIKGRINITIF